MLPAWTVATSGTPPYNEADTASASRGESSSQIISSGDSERTASIIASAFGYPVSRSALTAPSGSGVSSPRSSKTVSRIPRASLPISARKTVVFPLMGGPAISSEDGKVICSSSRSAASGIYPGKRKHKVEIVCTAKTCPSPIEAVPATPSLPPPGSETYPLQMLSIALCMERPVARNSVSSSIACVVTSPPSGTGSSLPFPASQPVSLPIHCTGCPARSLNSYSVLFSARSTASDTEAGRQLRINSSSRISHTSFR